MDLRWFIIIACLAFLLRAFWPRKKLDRIWQAAATHFENEHFAESESLYSSLLQEAEKLQVAEQQTYIFPAVYGIAVSKTAQLHFHQALPWLKRSVSLLNGNEAIDIAVGAWCELITAATWLGDRGQAQRGIDELRDLLKRQKPVEQDLGLDLIRQYGQSASSRDQPELAEKLLQLVLQFIDERPLPDPDLTVRTKLDLAGHHQAQGRYAESEELIQQTTSQNFVDLEPNTLHTMWTLIANQAQITGCYQKSKQSYERLIDDLIRNETDNVRIIYAKVGLLGAHYVYGHYKEAFRLAEEVQTHRANIRETDPEFDSHFVPIWHLQGKLNEIEATIDRLESTNSQLSQTPAMRVYCLNVRVLLLSTLNCDEVALVLARKASTLAESAKTLGPNHPTTVYCRLQVALTLANLHRTDEARAIVDSMGPHNGRSHARASLLSTAAWISLQENDYDGVEEVLDEMEVVLHEELAASHTSFHDIARFRGQVASGRGEHAKAIVHFADCESQMRSVHPANHPFFVWLYEPWRDSLHEVGNAADAEEKTQQVNAIKADHAAIAQRLVSSANQMNE